MKPLTEGDSNNEATTSYRFEDGVHNIRMLDQVNPEVILMHKARMVSFWLKTKGKYKHDPVPREIKDVMLKGIV